MNAKTSPGNQITYLANSRFHLGKHRIGKITWLANFKNFIEQLTKTVNLLVKTFHSITTVLNAMLTVNTKCGLPVGKKKLDPDSHVVTESKFPYLAARHTIS